VLHDRAAMKAEFERLGQAEVRRKYDAGEYNHAPAYKEAASRWLLPLEQAERARAEASQAEQMAIARSAKKAAWAAAIAAIVAAIVAIIAAVISALAWLAPHG
jgi:hypothetical protein